ncbi:hypothetical protein Tco_0247797 [Tanacetum coccineum]
MTFEHNSSSLEPQCQMTFEQHSFKPRTTMSIQVPATYMTITMSMIELEKSIWSFVRQIFQWRNVDASDKRQQQPDSTSSTSTLATTVTADGNFDL